MKGLTGRYLNEIVALTIMLLMTVALIDGQAEATVHETARSDAGYSATNLSASFETTSDAAIIHADFLIQVDLDQLMEAGIEIASSEAVREPIRIKFKTGE